ncbi:MAG: RCC1 repeat-containing protein [Candidatus Brocadia sp. WS118]|nr:MAG: RCC1 repeat-containing protein [Candidatus Brocadia sp. WS118]
MENRSSGLVKNEIRVFLFIAVLIFGVLAADHVASAQVNPQIHGGGFHSLALKPDDTVWAWGRNDYGQLGNGTTGNSNVPVLVGGGTSQTNNFHDVLSIAGGWLYSMALKSDGTVWTWGRNDFGQLGDGTTNNSTVPVQVNKLTGVTAISAGGFHCLALKSDGSVWSWGRNDFGQLGNGTTINSTVPVQVNKLTGITAISAGGFHCLALKSDGSVWSWGRNDFGQLGNGTTINSTVPVQVNKLTGITAISASGFHCLALKSNNTVWSWGRNDFGQLGNGTTVNSTLPVQVKNLGSVIAIERGRSHSLAIKSNGTVWTWGRNDFGQLGNGTTNNSSIPVQAKNLSSIAGIAGGGFHCLALTSEDTAWAWGRNDLGQLGDGTTIQKTAPVQVFIDLSIGTGNIAGRVTNTLTGVGINGVTVALDTTGTATTSTVRGVDGVYGIPSVPVGQHTITASALNYTPSSQTVTVEDGNPDKTGKNVFNLQLAPGPGTPTPTPAPGTGNVAGRVTDSQTGDGINGVTVALDTGESAMTSTARGIDGVYALQNAPVGQHEITASAQNYTSSSQTVTVEEGNPDKAGKNVFNFELAPGPGTPTPAPTPGTTGNIAGRVKDSVTDAPINDVKVVVSGTGKEDITLANGVYQITGVPLGQQVIEASKEGYETASQNVVVEAGNPDPQTGANIFHFQLAPIPVTPSPTPFPTPVCEADSMAATPTTMQLTEGESGEETITVVCEDGSPAVGEIITWKVKLGKKRITITPNSAITNANGEARFTITAEEPTGNAKIKFKDTLAKLKTTVTVQITE